MWSCKWYIFSKISYNLYITQILSAMQWHSPTVKKWTNKRRLDTVDPSIMSDSPGDTFCHQCRSVKERRVFFFVSLSGDDHTAKSRTLLPSIIRLSFHCFCDQLSLALEKAESKRCNEKIFLPFFHIYLLRHSWVPYLDHLCGMCLGEFSFRLL